MKRRDFIAGLGTAAWPVVAQAQQPAMPVIGFLAGATLESMREDVGFFHQGLAETGYIENRNVMIEYRWAEGDNNRLPVLAANLVRRRVDIIVAFESTPAALAAKAATQTIPVVFQVGPDPVQSGLVASLARPGGNLTGNVSINVELIAKTISLVHELVPRAGPSRSSSTRRTPSRPKSKLGRCRLRRVSLACAW
jgi:putative tryptophan/tyrosine transport system substrate-binding protein